MPVSRWHLPTCKSKEGALQLDFIILYLQGSFYKTVVYDCTGWVLTWTRTRQAVKKNLSLFCLGCIDLACCGRVFHKKADCNLYLAPCGCHLGCQYISAWLVVMKFFVWGFCFVFISVRCQVAPTTTPKVWQPCVHPHDAMGCLYQLVLRLEFFVYSKS